jgi:hypothetical protein
MRKPRIASPMLKAALVFDPDAKISKIEICVIHVYSRAIINKQNGAPGIAKRKYGF